MLRAFNMVLSFGFRIKSFPSYKRRPPRMSERLEFALIAALILIPAAIWLYGLIAA